MNPTVRILRDRQEDVGDGVFLHVFTSEHDPRLVRFFEAYDRAFILEDEKEDLQGFKACLRLNAGDEYLRLSGLYGPYREVVILLTRGPEGPVLGAANFIAFAGDGRHLTVSLSYIFVTTDERRKGYFSRLVETVRSEAQASFDWPSVAPEPLVFIEMNDPVQMPAEDYARDSAHAGLDQIDRLRIWQRRGARVIGLSYRQPPLSANQSADSVLLLGVMGAEGNQLDACLLRDHMRRFFGVTVLKGAHPMQSPVAAEQIARLEDNCQIGNPVELKELDGIIEAAERVQRDRRMPA